MSQKIHKSDKSNSKAQDCKVGMLQAPLTPLDDSEGGYVPQNLPPIIDAHVHLFPDHIFASIWKWFDRFGWPIRYKLTSAQAIEFLLSRGIHHIVGLHYAHKPGIARELNRFMADICGSYSTVTGMATVMPGEKDADMILKEAFDLGLSGVKLHSHVQCFDLVSKVMDEIYETCVKFDKPLIMHAGREPKSPGYRCDPHQLCSAEKLESIIRNYPNLKICVPHMGADEFDAYGQMVERYDNLWLDTTMALAEYLPTSHFPNLAKMRTDRIIFGSDFPGIPYAWDREIKKLCQIGLPESYLTQILSQNARDFYAIHN
jgi:predicted TIM-barrel fold metal-dependent hydrolase